MQRGVPALLRALPSRSQTLTDRCSARWSSSSAPPAESASSFLRRQALEEDAAAVSESTRAPAQGEKEESVWDRATAKPADPRVALGEQPWEGEEPQERALRRILEDSSKPLKIKGYVKKLPIPAPLPNILFDNPPIPVQSTSKVLNPWDVVFKAPDNYVPAVKVLNATMNMNRIIRPALSSARSMKKAREESLDYEQGFGGRMGVYVPIEEGSDLDFQADKRTGMGGMRAWTGIVDDKIEEARRNGLFKKVKGRGKPMERDDCESNPYISRDEFLINRIVKQQGAAPVWIELQRDLDAALDTFRTELRQAWFRRATRMRSLDAITRSTLTEIREGWRDPEWEARENAYHLVAIASLNSQLSRFNIQAPYAVRRAPLAYTIELASCIRDSSKAIEAELKKRMDGFVPPLTAAREGKAGDREFDGTEEGRVVESAWGAFKRAMGEVVRLGRA